MGYRSVYCTGRVWRGTGRGSPFRRLRILFKKINRPNALYRRFFGGRVYARQRPSRALLPLLSRAIDSRCACGAERANPGSLGRLSRVVACAHSSGLHPLFCTILHWGSRRSARDKNFGRGFWSAFLYRYTISARKQSGKRPPPAAR
jgi:hypothetical protein